MNKVNSNSEGHVIFVGMDIHKSSWNLGMVHALPIRCFKKSGGMDASFALILKGVPISRSTTDGKI